MRNPDAFDAFYKDARDRLLLQTYALTGDLTASRTAVRGLLRRRLAPLAQDRAARRPGGLGAPARLGARAAPAHRPALAPRQGPRPRGHAHAGRARQAAAHPAQDAAAHPPDRGCRWTTWPARSGSPAPAPSASSRPRPPSSRCTATSRPPRSAPLFEPLRTHVAPVRWPRPTDPAPRRRRPAAYAHHRRRGRRRRRAGARRVRWSPTRPASARRWTARRSSRPGGGSAAEVPSEAEQPRGPAGHAAAERDAARRRRRPPGRRAGAGGRPAPPPTPSGDGLVLPCQQERYADPRGQGRAGAHVRDLAAPAESPRSRPSRRPRSPAARGARETTFDTTAGWYAGCTDRRVQLLSTQRVDRVGRRGGAARAARLGRARDHDGRRRRPHRARHHDHAGLRGRTDRRPAPPPRPRGCCPPPCPRLCDLPDAGGCAGRGRGRRGSPDRPAARRRGAGHALRGRPAAGAGRGRSPGSAPSRAGAFHNVAATSCDRADFARPDDPQRHPLLRGAALRGSPRSSASPRPSARCRAARAAAFVDTVRARIDGLPRQGARHQGRVGAPGRDRTAATSASGG